MEPILPVEGLSFWKASAYGVEGVFVAAGRSATWERSSPGAFYRPARKRRELEAGPHTSLLRLRAMVGETGDLGSFPMEVKVFASAFGLLGLLNDSYQLAPVLPDVKKLFIAPEAEITADGRLRQVDPETEGMEMVLDVLARQYPDRWRPELADAARRKVALPSEVGLIPRSYAGSWKEMARVPGSLVPWTEAREPYGALFVLDPASSTRVSILSTREPLEPLIRETAEHNGPPVVASGWETALKDFPAGPYNPGDPGLRRELNSRLAEVSPYLHEDAEDFRRGWRCRSLLEAMALMMYLDLTGGSAIRECALPDCSTFFRLGSQAGSKYCSAKHASLATTRRQRERTAS